jgi:hypothetical protein
MRTRWIRFLLPAVLAALPPPAAAAENDRPVWSFETGVLAGHHSNYFFRADEPGTEAPSADVVTIYLRGALAIDLGRHGLNLTLDAGGDLTRDIPGADNRKGDFEVEYKGPRTRLSGRYFMNPNRIFSETGEGVFFDLSGFEVEARRTLGKGLWLGAAYESEDWAFDAAESDRDADSREVSLTLRVPLGARVGARLTGLKEDKEARASEHSWTGDGFAASVEVSSRKGTRMLVRYKRRERAYEDAPPGTSNFGREDVIEDYLLSLRVPLGPRFGLRMEDSYRRGASTRPDRNYDAAQVAAGVFFLF